jgi:hypothetical protein
VSYLKFFCVFAIISDGTKCAKKFRMIKVRKNFSTLRLVTTGGTKAKFLIILVSMAEWFELCTEIIDSRVRIPVGA